MKIKVGCCGFPVAKSKYYEKLKLVEIQQTFYKLIDGKTLEKWRKEAPKDFEFTFKAFQGLTHSIKSPTWKKSGLKIEELKRIEKYVGGLKVNKVTMEFWDKMLEYAKILNSKIIVIQLPSSFTDNENNIKQTKEFLKNVEDKKIRIALELRGWKDSSKREIFENFDAIEIVDLNVSLPTMKKDILYSRLHGKYENNKIVYKYDYSREELEKIKNRILELNSKINYILFNNSFMFKNALEFITIL